MAQALQENLGKPLEIKNKKFKFLMYSIPKELRGVILSK